MKTSYFYMYRVQREREGKERDGRKGGEREGEGQRERYEYKNYVSEMDIII